MNTTEKKQCDCDFLKEDQTGFKDWDDFYDFKESIENNLLFERIYGEISLCGEKPVVDNEIQGWFQCQACKSKWCLHMPDPPFCVSLVKATWRK